MNRKILTIFIFLIAGFLHASAQIADPRTVKIKMRESVYMKTYLSLSDSQQQQFDKIDEGYSISLDSLNRQPLPPNDRSPYLQILAKRRMEGLQGILTTEQYLKYEKKRDSTRAAFEKRAASRNISGKQVKKDS